MRIIDVARRRKGRGNPFYLDANGVTIRLKDGYPAGTIGQADGDGSGKVYQAVSQTQLENLNTLATDWSTICTTLCTNFGKLFANVQVNPDIAHFDTSNVTNMFQFARFNTAFNSEIGFWDTSSLSGDARECFRGASSFNQPLNNWDVSGITNFLTFFDGATSFNQDLSGWDVSSAVNMSQMFSGASSFNQDIGSWDVSNVTSMTQMFQNTSFNQNISNWNVSNVTFMSQMFQDTPFNQDIGSWNTSSVANMNNMFRDSSFNQDISSWCVENIPSEPTDFATGSPLDSNPSFKPNWGSPYY
jgi:surface protein